MAIFSKNYWLALKKFTLSASEGKGFTMIELLVVITIIGLLAAAAGGNYMTSLKKGRDTQRKGDMRKIQQAFEQYYGANQKYAEDSFESQTGCITMASGYFVGPFPPTGPRGESYSITCRPGSYCACARLEMDGKGNSSDQSCNYGGDPKNYFCVSSLQ